uniref:Uncharacterized protein n=2 Tax=Micrurus TaxID=8634 RepID=A0A2D4Q4I1_MICSU
MMEQSKKSSLVVAKSILNNKLISKKLERYLKGENPFTDDPEEKEEHEESEAGTSGIIEEGTAEGEGNLNEEQSKSDDNPSEENPVADESAENKGDGEELQGQTEEWNLTTSQESFATEQNPEHEEKEKTEETQDIVPSEKTEPPDE